MKCVFVRGLAEPGAEESDQQYTTSPGTCPGTQCSGKTNEDFATWHQQYLLQISSRIPLSITKFLAPERAPIDMNFVHLYLMALLLKFDFLVKLSTMPNSLMGAATSHELHCRTSNMVAGKVSAEGSVRAQHYR